MLFANRTEDDILLKDSLKAYEKVNPKFKCYYSVDKSITSDWKGYVGFIDNKKIEETLPENLDDTLFMSCGPPILSNIVEKIWMNMKIPLDRIYRF